MILALLGSLVVEAAEPPPAEVLKESWEGWRAALNAHATYPFRFSDKEWKEVAAGKVTRRRERLTGTDRVLGMIWVDADLDTTWLAIQDEHADLTEGLINEDLPGSTMEKRYLFQSLDMPWPLATRQWVILVLNNGPLRTATGGAFWERSWDLSDRRGAQAERPDGVWLDVNEGGWFLAEAGGGTLLGYHARTVVGGIVPDELVTRWSFGRLKGMLTGISERTSWIRTHYVGAHEPIHRPGGAPIPPFSAP